MKSLILFFGLQSCNVPLREVMARPMPQLDASVTLEEVYRILLSGNPAVLVTRQDRLAGLITRSDLMEFYERDRHPLPADATR